MKYGYLILLGVLLSACGPQEKQEPAKPDTNSTPAPSVEARPSFSGDSAYHFVDVQVNFGPRVPGTESHEACGDWLVERLGEWSDQLVEQTGSVKAWDGTDLPMRNIVASFNPDSDKRVLLCAHWDTRPVADEDPDASRHDEPIMGANDGGSGVAVLMEVARNLSKNRVDFGVDIVLFDVEDYGKSEVANSYCLGSQYWGRDPHVAGYRADYGILLDMVGADGAYFYREGISMHFASHVVDRVWAAAGKAGASSFFLFNEAPYPQLTDDHLYVNQLTGIPTIDIIQYDRDTPKGFGDFWHTHRDNMDIISARTLEAVGETLLEVLYSE
jgi:hypothetical protein